MSNIIWSDLPFTRDEYLRQQSKVNRRLLVQEKDGTASFNPSYQKAIRDHALDPDKPRYSMPSDNRDAIRKMRNMMEFEMYKTSTKTGYRKVLEGRYDVMGIEMPSNLQDAYNESQRFFNIADRAQDILKDRGSYLQYREVFVAIQEMMQIPGFERLLSSDGYDIEDVAVEVLGYLEGQQGSDPGMDSVWDSLGW